jgi:hypothetical protein
MSHKAVSTAEKRAELDARGEPWPVCECHGVNMDWSAKSGRPAGGNWHCAVRRKKNNLKWYYSKKGQEMYSRQIRVFGTKIVVPKGFKETTIALREERRAEIKKEDAKYYDERKQTLKEKYGT